VQGIDALPDLLRTLLNAAMLFERQKHLGAAPHERTEQRTGHANSYKDKTLWSRTHQCRNGRAAAPGPDKAREGDLAPGDAQRTGLADPNAP